MWWILLGIGWLKLIFQQERCRELMLGKLGVLWWILWGKHCWNRKISGRLKIWRISLPIFDCIFVQFYYMNVVDWMEQVRGIFWEENVSFFHYASFYSNRSLFFSKFDCFLGKNNFSTWRCVTELLVCIHLSFVKNFSCLHVELKANVIRVEKSNDKAVCLWTEDDVLRFSCLDGQYFLSLIKIVNWKLLRIKDIGGEDTSSIWTAIHSMFRGPHVPVFFWNLDFKIILGIMNIEYSCFLFIY